MLVALASGAALVSAPLKKSVDAPIFFPHRTGDTLVYRQGDTDTAPEELVTVTKVEEEDDAVLVTVTRKTKDKPAMSSKVRIDRRGVFRLSIGTRPLDPPVCLLATPATRGTTWSESIKLSGGETATTKYTIGPEEEIEVPAGKFRSIRVDVDSEINGEHSAGVEWHAPEVGLVKSVTKVEPAPITIVLKSRTAGK
jgi:hypothetical protein